MNARSLVARFIDDNPAEAPEPGMVRIGDYLFALDDSLQAARTQGRTRDDAERRASRLVDLISDERRRRA